MVFRTFLTSSVSICTQKYGLFHFEKSDSTYIHLKASLAIMNETNQVPSDKIADLNEVYEELAQGSVRMSEAILDVSGNLLETKKVYGFIADLALFGTLISGTSMVLLGISSTLSLIWASTGFPRIVS